MTRVGSRGWLEKFSEYLTESSPNEDGEVRGYCPIHENPKTSRTPSASYNPAKNKFHCFSRCGGYTLAKLWEIVKDDRPANVRSIGSARSRRVSGELPNDVDIKAWTQRLMSNAVALGPLTTKRGLTAETIEKYEIGWNGERYTIPVRDREGVLLNVRRYKFGASHDKMLNWPGYGQAEIFLSDAVEGDEIVICEGEMDALVARQYGFPACSTTAGAGTWSERWTPLFAGKRVYIVYDVDEQGIQGAKKVAVRLNKAGAQVYIVKLPLTTKGSDVTNYFIDQGFGKNDFRELLNNTRVFEVRTSSQFNNSEIREVSLVDSFAADLVGRPIEVVGTISGKVHPPYTLPQRVQLDCAMDWSKAKCAKCPMEMYYNGQHVMDVPADSRLLLRLVDKNEEAVRKEMLKEMAIPAACPAVEITNISQWAVEQLIVVPAIDDNPNTISSVDRVDRVVYNVGAHNTPVNTTVRFVGSNGPDPRSQRMVMQAWECQETRTSLDSFRVTTEMISELSIFQPAEGERPVDKLWAIAEDLAANVTKIYGRNEMHIAYDLVWHSLLDFRFRRTQIGKGWLELLVVGDTRTGKSEAAMRLSRHYQAGVLTSCEGATLAGLVGGAQQVGNSWVITWGTIPLQDRRLVILDEVSGLKDRNVLENMSEVRSSGRARVTKIVSQETNARTRLIWISNPVDGRRINEMPRGAIDGIVDLIKNPEDIARFDLAMVAASEDVRSSVINAARPPRIPHVYTTDLCAKLVLWAWSRGPRDVLWERGAERLVLRIAEAMGGRYVADPPLLQAENARVKLARIAVAIAARLFSHDGTGQKVLVTHEHVRTARRLLDRLYRQPSFGYAAHSAKEIRARQEAEEGRQRCGSWLKRNPHVLAALRSVVNDKEFRVRDLEEFGGLSRDESQLAIGELLRMQMIRRHTKGYIRMQPELVRLVRLLEERMQ